MVIQSMLTRYEVRETGGYDRWQKMVTTMTMIHTNATRMMMTTMKRFMVAQTCA